MEYSKKEIDYVDYCVKYLPDCQDRKRKCPLVEICDVDEECQQLCTRVVDRMNNGEILSEEDREIVKFFYNATGLWGPENSEGSCCANDAPEPCPNFMFCNTLEPTVKMKEPWVCSELIRRLDSNIEKMAEKEIQKAILENFPNEWMVGEKVVPLDSERPIREINGRIDLLLKGEATDTVYIVELKLRATREHVGQLASYVGWCRKNPITEQKKAVKGILLAKNFDKGALSALEVCHDLLVAKKYNLHVKIVNIEPT